MTDEEKLRFETIINYADGLITKYDGVPAYNELATILVEHLNCRAEELVA